MRDFFDIGRLVRVGACGSKLVGHSLKSGTPLSADSRPAEVCVCVCDVGVCVRGWSLVCAFVSACPVLPYILFTCVPSWVN